MWTILITVHAFVLLALATTATGVALFATDHRRGARASRVLAVIMTTALGGGGLVALALRLHLAGLL